jgi:hypothetical protein
MQDDDELIDIVDKTKELEAEMAAWAWEVEYAPKKAAT